MTASSPTDERAAALAAALLRPAPVRVVDDAAGWVAAWRTTTAASGDAPLRAAITASVAADRLAWPFFCAYQAAVREIFGAAAAPGEVASFAANESGRKVTEIETRLERAGAGTGGVLRGAKSWCLRAVDPFAVYVLARDAAGPAQGPGSLAVVRVASDAPGVTLSAGPAQPIVPELPHARIAFDGVAVDAADVLPGDGYARYTRPFRVAEDLCMAATGLAYLAGEAARGGWPQTWRQRAVAAVALLEHAFAARSGRPEAELLIAGALSIAADVAGEAERIWQDAAPDGDALRRWTRDGPLLAGGRELRRRRAQGAWERLRRDAA
jgi:hypothetical protein